MVHRVVLVSLAFGLAAARSSAAQGVREFTVAPRDSTAKALWTGYSFRGRSGASSSKAEQAGYTMITAVVPGSPAERAGLKVGDEILSINGYDRATRPDSARYFEPGRPAALRVRRGETILNLTITPIPPPKPSPSPITPPTR